MNIFKAASKYHIMTLSEGKAYILHGSVVRVSALFGVEIDLMIQFCVAHLTSSSNDISIANCSYLFREVILQNL